ncbi:hypothetical protein JVU11DRAFT_9353 [Chiua virens]|nr:hypothetical protein JVU11DRAFT_9353 [Chiua virens]
MKQHCELGVECDIHVAATIVCHHHTHPGLLQCLEIQPLAPHAIEDGGEHTSLITLDLKLVVLKLLLEPKNLEKQKFTVKNASMLTLFH